MLNLLRDSHTSQKITLTFDLKRDLHWFSKLPKYYNGVNLYDHVAIHQTLELDACLTGLGGRLENCVYHLPIKRGYENCTIVYLEMVNILLALRFFATHWEGRKVLVWYVAALHDVDLHYVHMPGTENSVADLLSRWMGSIGDWNSLCSCIPDPVWLHITQYFLYLDPEL